MPRPRLQSGPCWRGPAGCQPECSGLKPPFIWSQPVPEDRARPDCELITIAEAEETAHALAEAGILVRSLIGQEPDYEVRQGFVFTETGSDSFVHIHPALPHDAAACGEG